MPQHKAEEEVKQAIICSSQIQFLSSQPHVRICIDVTGLHAFPVNQQLQVNRKAPKARHTII